MEPLRNADRRVVGPLQLRLLRIVADVNRIYPVPDLRLEGGTALSAYHLVHRESRDLDFFAAPSLNAAAFTQPHPTRLAPVPADLAGLLAGVFLPRDSGGGKVQDRLDRRPRHRKGRSSKRFPARCRR